MPKKSTSSNQTTIIAIALVAIVMVMCCVFLATGRDPLGLFTKPTENSQLPAAVPAQTIPPATGNQVQPGGSGLPGWLTVYFTDPNPADNLENGIDKLAVAAINNAKSTIDIVSFDFNLPSVTNALVAAKKRGVKVRVAVDDVNGNQVLEPSTANGNQSLDAVAVLTKAKIPVVKGGRSTGLMHDKIILIDDNLLFTGSWNMSYNDTFRNNNNLLVISDPMLIANYKVKLDEMLGSKQFGHDASVGASESQLSIQGTQVENYFTPVDDAMARIIQLVQGAKRSVYFMAFTYTDKDLANAMIKRYKSGVDVRGVIENRGASNGALVPLYCAKVPVMVDGNKYTMHHKVIVIDESIVVTGSFNFTVAANQDNDENVLIIHSPALASQYLQEYQRVSEIARAPNAADFNCK
jgi:phosphatidylserine/phosphatidylglycerophosphate/cardiolipin synthase-like enzyme